jgi:DNA invertase Pin-like site-specific DNA recombinase
MTGGSKPSSREIDLTTFPTDMKSKGTVAVYLRVSTAEQRTESQEHQVLNYCRKRGWRSPRIFRDSECGASRKRPGLDSMLSSVRDGSVRHVVTYKLDRLGRSLTHLAIMVGEFRSRNVGLICTSQGIDTSQPNPVAQLQLGILMAVAEFERALISERTIAGLAVARGLGKRIGRPPLSPRKVRRIIHISRRLGGRIRETARKASVSPSTVSRVLSRRILLGWR